MCAGKTINHRHNTGLENKGEYLHMAQAFAVKNRIPTSHYRCYFFLDKTYNDVLLSDKPLKKASEVNYYMTQSDLQYLETWCKYVIKKTLTDYVPSFKKAKKYIRYCC